VTTSRTVPIYEVFEQQVEPALNQKFFARKSQAERYKAALEKSLPGVSVKLTLHHIMINREGICLALNNLPSR
jgi:hypothetical protein